MTNLDHFNRITATVLSKCFERFPVPCDFSYKEFYPEECGQDVDDFDEVFYHTMLWLQHYGYIYFWKPELSATSFYHVSLTEKSLNILNKIPESLEEKVSLGQKLCSVMKSGVKGATNEIIKMIFVQGYTNISQFIS